MEVDGSNAADETNHTLEIAADGSVKGHTGCNKYTAVAIIDGVNMAFEDIKVTENKCLTMVTDNAEKAFLTALTKAAEFNVNVNVLRIYDSETNELLMLRRLGTFSLNK